MKNIQFVTAVHGNEPMPTLALADMGVKQIVANPRALARGVRFTEMDLNASFGRKSETYEEQRARELMRKLDREKLVVDFHTFSCKSEPFGIIVDFAMLPLARKLGVKRVVYMKYNIKGGHALINYCPGVSVEVGSHTDPDSFELTQKIVNNLKRGIEHKIQVYEVFGRIKEKGEYTNFQSTGKFFPVLYGERAYDSQKFYGLKAKEITGTI